MKGITALNMAIANYPGNPSDLTKLAELDPRLRAALEANPRFGVLLKMETTGNAVEIWKMATTEELLDGAYALRLRSFDKLPPKNAEAYQVINIDGYDMLVHPREYVGRHIHDLDKEEIRRVHEDAKKQRKLASQLYDVNEEVWDYYALPSGNLTGLVWLAKNFTIEKKRLVAITALAATQGKLALAKQVYDAYQGKVEPMFLLRESDLFFGDPFFESLVEDRAAFAVWLASVYDMKLRVVNSGKFLFAKLFELNNLAAVKWLMDKYGTPPLLDVFNTDNVPFIAKELWLMENFGRPELGRFLAERYHIAPVPMTPDEVKQSYSKLALAPPPTKRWSQVPEGFWPK